MSCAVVVLEEFLRVAADGVAVAAGLDEHAGGQDRQDRQGRQGRQAGGDLPDVQVLGLDNGQLSDELATQPLHPATTGCIPQPNT